MNRLWMSRQWFSRMFGKSSRAEWFHQRAHRRGRWSYPNGTGFGQAAETLEDRLLLATIVVDDDGERDQTSIQDAINVAMAGDVIVINGGADRVHTEAGITINKDLTIQGAAGATQVIVQAAAQAGAVQDRVFSVASQTTAIIDNLTIRHGHATDVSFGESGGGILNAGFLTITNSTITQNFSSSRGGGIANVDLATLRIANSTMSRNSVSGDGGGIFNTGFVHLVNSTLSENSATGSGGGVFNFVDGEFQDSSVRITNSTIVKNLANSDGDESGSGGGIWTTDFEFTTTSIYNTIVAGNVAVGPNNETPSDIANKNVTNDSDFNLIGDPGSAGGLFDGMTALNNNIVGQSDGQGGRELLDLATVLDPNLADNGGPTLTHDLVAGSPAIDAGSNSLATAPNEEPLTTDQRGLPRIVDIPDVPNADGGVDIGAVEFDLTLFDIIAVDAIQPEGDASATAFTFLVTRSGNTSGRASVNFNVVGMDTDANDFAIGGLPSGTLQFDPGQTERTLSILVAGDLIVEQDESFLVELSNPVGAVLNTTTASGTILNDDVAAIFISDASASERDGVLTFTISLSSPVTEEVHVDLRTRDLTATSLFGEGQDYIPLPPDFFVTFTPGMRFIEVEIQINEDLVLEPNETFEVKIVDVRIGQGPTPPAPDPDDDSTRIVVGDGTGIGTILNDENIQVFGAGNGSGIESMPPVVIVQSAETGTELPGFENFLAYDGAFRGGVRVAAADVNGDGVADVITAPGPGGGPHIRVFDGLTSLSIADFFAYDSEFFGGVFVAAADVNADGFADIITGAGAGGGPHVKVFSGQDFALLHNFFAYDAGFAGGVSVATGRLDLDGFADIITGAGAGGGPHVRVFDGRNADLLEEFFAYDPDFLGGITVTSGDVNGDGLAEIITGAGAGGGPHVRIFNGQNPGQILNEFFAYDPSVTFGLFVGTTDTNSDGLVEILIGTGPGPSEVRIFDSEGVLVSQFIGVFNPHFRSGVHVAGSVTFEPLPTFAVPGNTFSSSPEIEQDLLGQVFDESTMDALLLLDLAGSLA